MGGPSKEEKQIQAQYRLIEALRASEERFRAIVEQSPISIQVFDREGRCLMVNEAWERLWGVPRKVLENYRLFEDEQLRDAGILDQVRRAFAGESIEIDTHAYDPGRNRGGSRRKMWLRARIYPLTGPDGTPDRVVVMHEDVTDQIERQQRERELHDLFEAAFEQSNDAIFIHDLEGRMMRANNRALEMFGIRKEDLPKLRVPDLHPASVHKEIRQRFEQFLAEGRIRFETLWKRADGSEFPGEVSATIITVAGQKLGMGLVRDLSKIRETERRFRLLFELIPDAVGVHRDGIWQMANPAAVEVFGAESEADLIGTPVIERVHPEDRAKVMERIRMQVEEGRAAPLIEERLLRLDGSVFWGEVQARPIEEDDGRSVLVVMRDITARKQAEQRLAESERRLRQVMEAIPLATVITRIADGKLLFSNRTGYELSGLDPDQAAATPAHEIYVHPEDRERMIAMLRERGEVNGFEAEMQKPDGTRFWALIHARRFEFEGEDAVLAVVLDDTARREAMARAKLLETAIEQSSEPVMLLDLEGQVVLANMAAAEVYGLDPGQMIGRHVAELRGGRPGDELHRSIVEHIRHGENWQGEFQLKQGDEVRTIARRVSPVFDERGELAWQIVIDRDVTEERQRQERMEHVQRLESLGVLAGGIAHDFNNLLAAIMGHASLARMKASPADPLLKHVEAIEKTSERAAELCQQMLAYAGKGRFVVRPINLSELVLEMTRLLEVSLHKGVVLRYELEPNLPAVEADAAQMQQVVMNLVTNANEAIGENSGIITLATGMMQADEEYLRTVVGEEEGLAPGRYVWLEVSDTGCGMDEETKARIFEPFFTTKFTGRGLGMSAILGIVRGHHGAIKIYSEPGRGTTIKVLLPASEQAPVGLGRRKPGEVDARGRRILVVDDEETVREVAAMMLEEMGYAVDTAADGVEAVERFRADPGAYACVLLDMTMPRMGGEATYTELRKLNPEVKVVLCSGYNEQTATSRFAGKGLAGFIQKPFSPEKLARALAEVLAD